MRIGRAGRIGLVLLVGVNLTLLCAGHDDGDHHTAPHFALLGEPADADHPEAPPIHTIAAPVQRLDTIPILTTASLLDTLGLALLDMILAAGLCYARPPLRRSGRITRHQGRPQTALLPERRPPRPVLTAVSIPPPYGGITPALA